MKHPRADFENFVAHHTDALIRTAYLIVWDLPEARTWFRRRCSRWPAAGTGSVA